MVAAKLLGAVTFASVAFAQGNYQGPYDCHPATQGCCDAEDDKCRTAKDANMSYCASLKAQCYKDAGLCNPYQEGDCPGGYPHSSQPGYETSSPTYPASTYPASTYPASTYPVSSYPVSTYPASTYPVSTYPASTYPGYSASSYPVSSYPVSTYPASSSYPVTYITTTCPATSYETHGGTTSPVVYTKTTVISECPDCNGSNFPTATTPAATTVQTYPAGSQTAPASSTGTIQPGAAANIKPAMGMLAVVLGAAML